MTSKGQFAATESSRLENAGGEDSPRTGSPGGGVWDVSDAIELLPDIPKFDFVPCPSKSKWAAAPDYWDSHRGPFQRLVLPASELECRALQDLLDGTGGWRRARDGASVPLPTGYHLVQALRNERVDMWEKYAAARLDVWHRRATESAEVRCYVPQTLRTAPMLAGRLDRDVGEAYLLHGTSPTIAQSILDADFLWRGGFRKGTTFGPGLPMAECSTKADELAHDDREGTYVGMFAMLVFRCVVGLPYVAHQPGDGSSIANGLDYDSVIGDWGIFREFVFFDEALVYPEYLVMYHREMEQVLEVENAAEGQQKSRRRKVARPRKPLPTAQCPMQEETLNGAQPEMALPPIQEQLKEQPLQAVWEEARQKE